MKEFNLIMEEPSGKFFTSGRGIEYCYVCKDNFKGQHFGKRCLIHSMESQQTINKMSCPLQINIISIVSKFNMEQITRIANNVTDCWLLLASPHLLKLFVHFTKVVPQCKFKLTDNKRQCKEVMNNGQKVLISKTKQGMLYCEYEKSVFGAIESIASDESRMVYYDTSNGSFCEEIPHICKLKNRQVKKTERKTLYRGLIRNNNKNQVLVNLKMCRFYTCPSRPISLKRKCKDSGVVPDGNVFPLSPTSYANDNYPTSIVAQTSDHDTDYIDYLSTISSQQEDGSPHAHANRFSVGLYKYNVWLGILKRCFTVISSLCYPFVATVKCEFQEKPLLFLKQTPAFSQMARSRPKPQILKIQCERCNY